MLGAGLSEYDQPERYRKDIFRQDLGQAKDQTMALSYVRFTQELEHLDGPGMFQRYPELYECVDPADANATEIAEGLTGMLKRHAQLVLNVMEEQISSATSELARESLPQDCLIRMIAGSSRTMGQDTGSELHEAKIQGDDLGQTVDGVGEGAGGFVGVPLQIDADEHGDAEADAAAVEHRPVAFDDPVRFQNLDPPQARRR